MIKKEFNHFASLEFELLCANFLAKKFHIPRGEISSFWDKNNEFDLFYDNRFKLIAECKYKDTKMCKNDLNNLIKKANVSNLNPDIVILFSKSGFSNELANLKSEKIKLISLEEILST